jgi:hypothetical protein
MSTIVEGQKLILLLRASAFAEPAISGTPQQARITPVIQSRRFTKSSHNFDDKSSKTHFHEPLASGCNRLAVGSPANFWGNVTVGNYYRGGCRRLSRHVNSVTA